MYYFKHFDQNLVSIEVLGSTLLPDTDFKVHIAFDPKHVLAVSLCDIDGNLFPVKKNSELRKTIFNNLINKKWDKFIIDGSPILGIVNEEEEIVEPFYVLYPEKRIKEKINPYQKWNGILLNNGLSPIKKEENVLYKKRNLQYLHIYYRIENTMFHVCFDEFETILVSHEIFIKTI